MIRKAKISDVPQIQALINTFAQKDLMLARSLNELYEHIRDYWVALDGTKIIGCAALHISWQELAEIKSLAVAAKKQHHGIGRKLVNSCIAEAEYLGAKKVFVLTYAPVFFKKFGFKRIKHENLPHKIWAECINCAKFPDCQEIAMLKSL
jgi:amino-acid N-acetyltransferase